jgi:hypothetical protein
MRPVAWLWATVTSAVPSALRVLTIGGAVAGRAFEVCREVRPA